MEGCSRIRSGIFFWYHGMRVIERRTLFVFRHPNSLRAPSVQNERSHSMTDSSVVFLSSRLARWVASRGRSMFMKLMLSRQEVERTTSTIFSGAHLAPSDDKVFECTVFLDKGSKSFYVGFVQLHM